mgnify:CR=1 FL=1
MSNIKCNKCGDYIPEEMINKCPICNDIKVETIKINKKNKQKNKDTTKVRIIDIEMEFGSMVLFIIKWTLASIPAMIILFFIGFIFAAVFGLINL